ncbi:MAG: helix-turn-helix domain-containing protein [Ghiorsea sp.]
MSKPEQARSEVMRLYVDGYIKQKESSKRIGLSVRQVRRRAKSYRLYGCHALVHGNRGNPSNRKVREGTKNQAIALIHKKHV